MRTDDLLIKLQKNIRINLSQKHLISLCTYFNLPISGRKNQIQEKLLNFINNQNYDTLKSISNKVDEYLRISSSTRPRTTTTLNRNSIRLAPEIITEFKLQTAPIDLLDEVPLNLRNDLSNPIITSQMEMSTICPIKPIKNTFFEYPNVLINKQVSTSPFYCCPTCLQPLTLLIALKPWNSNLRETSHQTVNFIITENVRNILLNNQYKVKDKTEYKWQILLRFVGVDVSQAKEVIGNTNEPIGENIPPYLLLVVNETNQPLWDILPSNNKAKEGRRHPKPIQITDKLKLISRNASGGYKQSVVVSWWQTPEVYTFYYVGVYLERKITVREMMNLYAPTSLFNNRTIEEILAWVQNKLGRVPNSSQNDDDCDDLVISNVLPINLNCPVSKGRIGVPLRTIHCEHLQCFDAVFFLSMNERRSVWKCPICDEQATPNDLFTDRFFLSILQHYKDDEDVSDVNVNPDNSFAAVKTQNRDQDQVDSPVPSGQTSVVNQATNQPTQDLIVLDSDEEEDVAPTKNKTPVPNNNNNNNTKQIPTPQQLSQLGLPKLVSAPTLPIQKQAAPPVQKLPALISKSNIFSPPPPYATPLSATKQVENNPPATPSTKDSQSNLNQTALRTTQSNVTELRTTKTIIATQLERSNNNSNANIFTSVTHTSAIGSISSTPLSSNALLLSSFIPDSSIPPVPFPIQLPSAGKPASSFMTCAITSTTVPISSSAVSNSVLNSNLNKFASSSAAVPSAFGNPISVISSRTLVDKLPQSSPITATRKSPTTTSKESIIAPSSKTVVSSIANNAGIQSRNSSSKFRSDVQVSPANRSLSVITSDGGHTKDITDDIVRTLPVINMPDLSKRNRTDENHSPEPITCPNVIIHQPDKKDKDPKNVTPASSDQTKKLDSHKRIKSFQSKIPPPTSNVTIPSLTIDLTEEDDDDQQPAVTVRQAVPLVSKPVTWVPVNGPISNNFNKMINGVNSPKYPQNHLSRNASVNRNLEIEKRKLAELGIGHYTPHQMLHNNTATKPLKAHIDLTADDDYDDRIPNKRSKLSNNSNSNVPLGSNSFGDKEEGQINDNESTTSNNSNNSKSINKNAYKNPLPAVSKRKP